MTTRSSLRLKIIRNYHSDECTGGIMTGGGFSVNTLEGPWGNNDGPLSCIPLGTYRVVLDTNRSVGNRWLVTGIPGRPAIELTHAMDPDKPPVDIVMHRFCNMRSQSDLQILGAPTTDIFPILTDELSGFTLEILQHLPYTDYLSKHGYASPHKQEIH